MSEVNLQFTVNEFSTAFTANTNEISFNPVPTELSIYTGYTTFAPGGAGNSDQVLYNYSGAVQSNVNFTYTQSTSTLEVINLNVNGDTFLGAAANVTMSGGANGYVLKTDGAGNIAFTNLVPAGGANTQLQFCNAGGFLAGIPTVTFASGNLSLGAVSNVKITGGTNGYVLQTDGTGNLTWTAQTGNGGGGNGTPGGSNTQIQYNDAGDFGGDAGFTYDDVLDTMSVATAAIGNVKTDNLLYANGSPYSLITSPAGSNTYIQFNNAGIFGAVSNFTFNSASNTLSVPNVTIGTNANIGNLIVSNSATCDTVIANIGNISVLNVSNVATFTDSVVIQQAKEKVLLVGTGATGTINYDIINQSIILQTANATADFTLDLRGNSTISFNTLVATGQSMTFTYINKNGSTAYKLANLRIDGLVVTPVYPLVPLSDGTVNGYDMYMFNVVKTGVSTYVVFGSYGNYQ